MNATIARTQVYKFGQFRFEGKKLSRASVRALQVVYTQWSRNDVSTLAMIRVMEAFGLKLTDKDAT